MLKNLKWYRRLRGGKWYRLANASWTQAQPENATRIEAVENYMIPDNMWSFLQPGDIVELEFDIRRIVKIESIRIVPNSIDRPTDIVIVMKISFNQGGIECTSNNFKYIRHVSAGEYNLQFKEEGRQYK